MCPLTSEGRDDGRLGIVGCVISKDERSALVHQEAMQPRREREDRRPGRTAATTSVRNSCTIRRLCAGLASSLLFHAAACGSTPGVAAHPSQEGGVSEPASTGGTSAGPFGDGGSVDDAGSPAVGTHSGIPDGGAASTMPTADGAAPPSVVTCPTTALAPGDTNETVQVGGVARTYILHVPTGYTGSAPVPLVLDFHPILANGAYEESNSGYKALADQEGFVVAFPNGIDNAWNIGPCCTMSRTVDDLGFAKATVTQIEKGACIDPKRVYAVGYSMGGGLSHYLACNAADVFAAVAPAAFDLLVDSEEPCHPSRPITVLSFRGTADPIVPYDGGASNPPNGLNVTIHFLGAQGTFQKWAQLDGCTGSPSAADSNGCSTYSQCSEGAEVTLCTKQGGGHDTGNPQIGWAMLEKHPMP